jgi:hypothetical protein
MSNMKASKTASAKYFRWSPNCSPATQELIEVHKTSKLQHYLSRELDQRRPLGDFGTKLNKAVSAMLKYEDTVVQSDIQRNLRCAYQLPKPAQDRIIAIIRRHKIRAWLGDVNSSVLFLNGHYKSSRAMAQSPTSFICARLASTMLSNKNASDEPCLHPPGRTIGISFFCAEDLDPKDPYQGAHGIVKSLIAQLLVSYSDFDTRLIKQLLKADLDRLKTLCAALAMLVCKLPKEVVLFCLIDAVTVHEESESRCKKVESVLETLTDIAGSDDGRRCVFKLLITSPRVSRRDCECAYHARKGTFSGSFYDDEM